MKVALGSVVKGLSLKTVVKEHLEAAGHEILDVGCHNADVFVKFPSIGQRIAEALQSGTAELAVNFCGSGTGAAIAAGKFRDVCAVCCESVMTARLIRIVNGANCLCMGESVVAPELACEMVDAFISAQFQKLEGIPEAVTDFWAEARDELMARGDFALPRKIETLQQD